MKEKSLMCASIVAAGAASLCCISPLLAMGLGLGTLGGAALTEEWRPWLLGWSGLVLAGAFYLTYRRRPENECAGGACAVSPKTRRGQKMLLWLWAAAVLLLGAFPYYSGSLWSASGGRGSAIAGEQGDARALAVFTVGGMTCAGCAEGIRAALEREPGVTAAVDYQTGVARIRFEPATTSVEELAAVLGKLGYDAKLQDPQS